MTGRGKSKIVKTINIVIITILIIIIYSYIKPSECEWNNQNQSNLVQQPLKEESTDSTLNILINQIYSSPLPFISKLLIFFGIIYLIQILFSASFDITEIFLIIFVLIKRTVNKIFGGLK